MVRDIDRLWCNVCPFCSCLNVIRPVDLLYLCFGLRYGFLNPSSGRLLMVMLVIYRCPVLILSFIIANWLFSPVMVGLLSLYHGLCLRLLSFGTSILIHV